MVSYTGRLGRYGRSISGAKSHRQPCPSLGTSGSQGRRLIANLFAVASIPPLQTKVTPDVPQCRPGRCWAPPATRVACRSFIDSACTHHQVISFRTGQQPQPTPCSWLTSKLSSRPRPPVDGRPSPFTKMRLARDDRCFSVSAFVTLLFPLSLLSPARGVSQLVCCLRCPGLSVLLWPAGRFAFASRPSLRAARARSRARPFALIRSVAFNPRLLGQPPRLSPRF